MSTKKSARKSKATETKTLENKTKTDNSPYVHQSPKISYDLNIKELPWTEKQKYIINIFLDKDTKILFMKGVAGTSKTMLAMYLGLQLLNLRKVSDLVLVRSAVESSDSKLGYLPGSMSDKVSYYMAPFRDKLEELLSQSEISKLEKDNRLTICPINFARGLHFSVKFICADELQNMSVREIFTLLSRIGQYSKVILCGDPDQSDLPYGKSGFQEVYDLFNAQDSKDVGIHCVELDEDDIVRSEICKFVNKKFKQLREEKMKHNI